MRTVTRLREVDAGTTDDYGNPVVTVTEVDIPGAMFAPERDSSEVIEVGRVQVPSKPTLYWYKTRPDITEHDQVRVDGDVYDVDGRPSRWQDDLGGTDVGGLVVTLKRVTG